MIATLIAAAALILCALIELLFPGKDLYHYGWFNVVLAALVVIAVYPLARMLRSIASSRTRAGFGLIVAGAIIAGFATIASGLLGPDTQVLIAAPGATVRVDELNGSLAFPIAASSGASQSEVQLVRGANAQTISGRRYDGPFLLESVLRQVVAVDVSDLHGGHLTITQPTGNTFLSPVLLMQAQQVIAGMTVPFDSFAVPAAHRVVKAVLFSAEQAERLPSLGVAQPAVLFDVENENEAEVKNGIAVARDGVRVTIGGIQLVPNVFDYPAVRVVSVPDIRIIAFSIILVVIGAILTRTRSRA